MGLRGTEPSAPLKAGEDICGAGGRGGGNETQWGAGMSRVGVRECCTRVWGGCTSVSSFLLQVTLSGPDCRDGEGALLGGRDGAGDRETGTAMGTGGGGVPLPPLLLLFVLLLPHAHPPARVLLTSKPSHTPKCATRACQCARARAYVRPSVRARPLHLHTCPRACKYACTDTSVRCTRVCALCQRSPKVRGAVLPARLMICSLRGLGGAAALRDFELLHTLECPPWGAQVGMLTLGSLRWGDRLEMFVLRCSHGDAQPGAPVLACSSGDDCIGMLTLGSPLWDVHVMVLTSGCPF